VDAEWTGVQPPRHPGAGLIEVGDLGPRQLLTDPSDEPAQPPGGLGRKPRQRPHRAAGPQHIAKHPRGPLHRHVMGHHQVARQPTDPWAIARRRARLLGKHPGGEVPATALAPLHAMFGDPQSDLGQVNDLPGLHPMTGAKVRSPPQPWHHSGRCHTTWSGSGTWARCAPGAPGCLPGARPPPRRSRRAAGGLPSPSCDGGRDELEESLPRRRSNSATRASSVAIRRACSALAATRLALAWRNWSITIAWTATVASRSPVGEEIQASWTTSGHARLPMGRMHSYPSNPPAVKPAAAQHHSPE